jgi:predicted RNase H-like HicB family nuclease
MRIAVVKAARDEDAGVWIVESSDVEGLWVEGETFEDFCRNVTNAVSDLLGDEADDIPIEIIAHRSLRIRTAA